MLSPFFAAVCILLQQLLANEAEPICPQQCECTGLSAHCRGNNDSWVNAVDNLPANIENFTFTIFTELYRPVVIDLSVHLGRLQNLTDFQIDIAKACSKGDYALKNGIRQIGTGVFCGLTRLKELRLNARIATGLNASAIACLKRLEVLDLSYVSKMKKSEILSLMAAPLSREITTLLLRQIQTFGYSPLLQLNFATLFTGLNRFKLEVLDLADNAFSSLSPGLLLMPRLRKLDLSGNLLVAANPSLQWTLDELCLHPGVEEVSVARQGLVTTGANTATNRNMGLLSEAVSQVTNSPKSLAFQPARYFNQFVYHLDLLTFAGLAKQINPKLSGMKLTQCVYNIQFPLGRNIRLVNASEIFTEAFPYRNILPRGCLCVHPNNLLQHFDISNNMLNWFLVDPAWEYFRTTGLNHLQTINMKNNNLKMRLQSPLFSGLPSLQTLLLGGNRVQLMNNDSFLVPKTLGGLRVLDLSRNLIETLPYLEFHFLSNMEVLDLSFNRLSEFDVKLPKSSSFKLLDLSGNKLTYIGVNMTAQLEAYKHLQVNFLENSFVCDCKTLHFVRWIQTTKVKLTRKDKLYCLTNLGQEYIMKLNFRQLYKDCNPLTLMQIVLISVSSTRFFFGLVMFSVYIYRRRWKIRYFLYRRRLRRQRAEQELSDDYEYDAFVSFCDQSDFVKQWAQTKLEMQLSDKRGLRLFIPQRDVLPHESLLQEIDVGMRKSRKVILILSPEYLMDWRCMYEAWEAHTTMLSEDRDAVVLVKLQPLPISGLPGTLTGLMEMRQCLTWTEDCVGQELFWERLANTLLSRSGSAIYD